MYINIEKPEYYLHHLPKKYELEIYIEQLEVQQKLIKKEIEQTKKLLKEGRYNE